jgi:quercetin dioxygenase-like cupin family protein
LFDALGLTTTSFFWPSTAWKKAGLAPGINTHTIKSSMWFVRGKLSVKVGNASFDVSMGDSFVVRGGVDHQATALEDSIVVDVFTPCRHDYL